MFILKPSRTYDDSAFSLHIKPIRNFEINGSKPGCKDVVCDVTVVIH